MTDIADVYATATDLAAWLAPVQLPGNADKLRRGATYVVAEATNRNPYTDSPTGDDAAALRDATCAQVASWIALGVDPDTVGVVETAPVKKASIDGADVEYDTKTQTEARSLAARELAPQAESILMAAGLLWVPVPLAETSGALQHFGLSGPQPYFPWQIAQDIDAYSLDADPLYGWPFR